MTIVIKKAPPPVPRPTKKAGPPPIPTRRGFSNAPFTIMAMDEWPENGEVRIKVWRTGSQMIPADVTGWDPDRETLIPPPPSEEEPTLVKVKIRPVRPDSLYRPPVLCQQIAEAIAAAERK